jgi:eukaryotic-like serine/threonine-protein kinase
MTHLWENWEGVSLSGNYTLERWLDGDDSAAIFQTSPGSDGRRAVVRLVPEAVVDGNGLLDLWQRTRQLRHPNLVELFECGRADHRGEIVLYAVFESPDDTLASALSQSPLSPQESREVVDSVLGALRYLHAQGLVLGALDLDHIVGVGDRIKLSTDALRDADTSSAYREDVRLLGELWQRELMSASPKSSQIASRAADPNPQSRWTLAEISAALDPPIRAVPPPAAPLTAAPVTAIPVAAIPVAAHQVIVHKEAPAVERAATHPFPKWIFVGAAGVLLLVLGLNRRRPADVATPPPVAAISLPAETPVRAPLPKVAEPKAAIPTVPKPSPAAGKEMWRVIAFTYRTRDAAARKVQQLNQYHPGLNAAVFSPKGRGGYYLVSLGGRMTHEEAVRVQHNARGKGLPRDLYVQNYAE